MRIVLDTGVLFRRAALARVADTPRPAVLPAVALAERLRQLRRDGRDVDRWLESVASWRFEVEPFGRDEARRLIDFAPADAPRWRRLARDALIAAHVRHGDELWTTNPRDFLALGLSSHQVVGV